MKCILNLFKKKQKEKYQPKESYDKWTEIEVNTLIAINLLRVKNGRKMFRPEDFLHDLAIERCYEIIFNEMESHTGVGSYFERMFQKDFIRVNELLGFNYKTVEGIVGGLTKSEKHKEKLLSDNTYCSVAYSNNVWVLFIGTL